MPKEKEKGTRMLCTLDAHFCVKLPAGGYMSGLVAGLS